jgi:hypothetical protein
MQVLHTWNGDFMYKHTTRADVNILLSDVCLTVSVELQKCKYVVESAGDIFDAGFAQRLGVRAHR